MKLRFEYRLKDGSLLDGITGGSLTFSVASTVKSSGKLQYVVPFDAPKIDWLNEEISISAFADEEEIPLGIFIPTLPDATYTGVGAQISIDVLDRLTILDQDLVPTTYSVGAGQNLVYTIISIIGGTYPLTYDTATEKIESSMFWSAGTSKLRIINDLLDAANYMSLWADTNGVFNITKYTKPMSRPIAHSFDYGELNEITSRSQNIFSIPNRFIAIGESEPDTEAPVAIAENHNPLSDYSYEQRGHWSTQTESGIKITSEEELQVYAERRLEELSGANTTVEVEHVLYPPELNSHVTATHLPTGLRGDFTVQKIQIPLSLAKTKTTLREVTNG